MAAGCAHRWCAKLGFVQSLPSQCSTLSLKSIGSLHQWIGCILIAAHNALHNPDKGSLQELVLFWVQPAVVWRAQSDSDSLHSQEEMGCEYKEMNESQADCRHKAGLSLRKAISQLPRLTCLTLSHVSFEEPGSDIVTLHPYSQLE